MASNYLDAICRKIVSPTRHRVDQIDLSNLFVLGSLAEIEKNT